MKFPTTVVILLKVMCPFDFAEATLTEDIAQNYLWDGVGAYIAVDRQVIQKKLNEWHDSISSVCDGPRLYLPASPVFPDVLNKNQHVVFISTGSMEFYDFQGLLDECISINGMEAAVTIPFLTDHLDGIPHYSLVLANFYEGGRGDIPKPNVALPYVPVDAITKDETGSVIRNGNEEIRLSFARYTELCEPESPVVRHEFEEYLGQELQFGVTEPDFSFCDRHPVENQYCTIGQSIKCALHRSSPNICQTSWKSQNNLTCDASVEIISISQGFRDMMLLGDGEIKVVASEAYVGNHSLGLKYPCIE